MSCGKDCQAPIPLPIPAFVFNAIVPGSIKGIEDIKQHYCGRRPRFVIPSHNVLISLVQIFSFRPNKIYRVSTFFHKLKWNKLAEQETFLLPGQKGQFPSNIVLIVALLASVLSQSWASLLATTSMFFSYFFRHRLGSVTRPSTKLLLGTQQPASLERTTKQVSSDLFFPQDPGQMCRPHAIQTCVHAILLWSCTHWYKKYLTYCGCVSPVPKNSGQNSLWGWQYLVAGLSRYREDGRKAIIPETRYLINSL